MFDAIIVGGSTAGLSAALYLGRFRRRVLIVDSQKPANRFSHAAHSFFTRDGVSPAELISIGRDQLRPYETVKIQTGEVTQVVSMPDGFTVTLADGSSYASRKILLATGMKDTMPPVAGLEQFWGAASFTVRIVMDGEQRDQPVAIYNRGELAFHIAKLLRVLTADLVLCSDGPSELTTDQQAVLTKHGIRIIETPIARVEGHDAQVESIVFADGTTLARIAIFVRPNTTHQSDFAVRLGCAMTDKGLVKIDELGRTSVTGVYAAGDIAFPARQLVMAASQGAMAGMGINSELVNEDFAV